MQQKANKLFKWDINITAVVALNMSVKALILCLSRDCVQSSSPCQWDGLSDSLLRSRGEHSASCPSGRLGHKSHFSVLLASSLGLLAVGVPTATSREALGKGLYDRNRVFLPKASKEFRRPPPQSTAVWVGHPLTPVEPSDDCSPV